jgi:hypothetical protein
MTEPAYHRQPITLDPNQEPPEDEAPLAQGHDRELAEEVKEAIVEHRETVEAEADQEEVTARAPGDHAGEEGGAEDPKASDDDVPDGTIDEVKAWVGDDPDRAQRALESERAGQNRTTLITYLESV